ncbi:salicylate hydroxylase [Neorhizobium lilium]|uniref:Salicylate hydroxylase n=1 Tax=Neorhizobium lilium TaxID=2503024 RepID=A0A444LCP3_9HYPH|nr:FAD-dependent monooxygenase [Neorhizobium lilium]RWX75623.1 salicylate hydroxylase [Neorhizobium lilium]
MPVEKVAIVGAGIAGLVTALAFARQGIASDVFEQAPELTEVGAGLQVSPNASRLLAELGLLSQFEAVWTEPERIALVSGTSLRSLAYVPAGPSARKRWGAPYGVLHRATLQRVLRDAVEANPLCTLHLDTPVREEPHAALSRLTGQAYPLVVGADGVWSNIRTAIDGSPRPSFSGHVCWRFTIPDRIVPSWLKPDQVTAFLGPSTHLVAYPLREIGGFNMVAIASGVSPGRTWHAEANESQKSRLYGEFRRWDRRIVDLLQRADQPTFWPLFEVGTGRWQNGRDTVLVGDAAHAITPFAAQGASMAIEDAFTLARCVSEGKNLSQALIAYETNRQERVAKVRSRGAFNRFAYHARGPVRLGRDLVLSLRPPEALAADLDWLYGYKGS